MKTNLILTNFLHVLSPKLNTFTILTPPSLFRHMRLNLIKNFQVNEDSCTICFAEKASHKLVPCEHGYVS